MEEHAKNPGFDPTQRKMCPDGACIGLIGADGRCKECGALSPDGPPPSDTDAEEAGAAGADAAADAGPDADRHATDRSPADADADAAADADADAGAGAAGSGQSSADPDAFDPGQRKLCSDGACIGLIGPDGRCKECGRQAE